MRFDEIAAFELAPGVSGRPLFGEGAMINLIEFTQPHIIRSRDPLSRSSHLG